MLARPAGLRRQRRMDAGRRRAGTGCAGRGQVPPLPSV